jgi:hypothetical protein
VENNKVILYDNLIRNSLKDRFFKGHPNISLVQGDVFDFESLTKAMYI